MSNVIASIELYLNRVMSLIGSVTIAIMIAFVTVAIFAPSPNGAPTASTIEFPEEMSTADKIVASAAIAAADWKVSNLKVVSIATGEVPVIGTKIACVGVNGRWHVAGVE